MLVVNAAHLHPAGPLLLAMLSMSSTPLFVVGKINKPPERKEGDGDGTLLALALQLCAGLQASEGNVEVPLTGWFAAEGLQIIMSNKKNRSREY